MKILAVDDDQSILTVIDHTLSYSAHHDVTTASSVKDAMKKIDRAETDFECFLIDIQMPQVDGIDLARLIRSTPGYERRPIVMLTAMHDKPYLDMAFQAGATDYITKPFNFRDLRSRIFDAQRLIHEKNQSFCECTDTAKISWIRGEANDNGPDLANINADFDGLIPPREFENYVLEMARRYDSELAQRRRCTAAIIALKVADPTLACPEISLADFCALLSEVGSVANLKLNNVLRALSYRGNGTFLGVLEKQLCETSDGLERDLNTHLQKAFENADTAGPRLFVGDQVPLRTASSSAVLDILWLATESVEQKFLSKRVSSGSFRQALA